MSESEQPPSVVAPEERRLELPAWVSIAIGIVLVLLAAMAVYTGFQTRVRPLASASSESPFVETDGLYPEDSGGPPGAPGPGGSRVSAENEVPSPGLPGDSAHEGLAISGDSGGVSGRTRLSIRRGLVFDVVPLDAVVYVNDVAVGGARQFGSEDAAYEFADEGVFNVKVSAPGHAEVELIVTAGPDAAEEVAKITLRLDPVR